MYHNIRIEKLWVKEINTIQYQTNFAQGINDSNVVSMSEGGRVTRCMPSVKLTQPPADTQVRTDGQ